MSSTFFAITVTYFFLLSNSNKQKMSFAFKMSPLFYFDLVPFGHKPTGPKPSGQTPLHSLGKGGDRITSQEACRGQLSSKMPSTCQQPPLGSPSLDRAVLGMPLPFPEDKGSVCSAPPSSHPQRGFRADPSGGPT